MEVSLRVNIRRPPILNFRLNQEPTSSDLRKMMSVLIQLATKDLEGCRLSDLSPDSSKEMVRTAYLMIFDSSYKMQFGNTYISLDEMIGLVCEGSDSCIVRLFKEAIRDKLCIEKPNLG